MQTKPCRKCGATVRHASGRCGPCKWAYDKVWRAANPEKHRATVKAWEAAHPGHRRERHLNQQYGITTGEYNQLLAVQAYLCPICKQPDPTHIDHDHKTGRIRGILHGSCNRGLGLLADDLDRLQAATAYLGRKRVSP